MRTKERSERKPRQRWHERTADQDIRYRGPLNYQHFQILGWLCIAATQLLLILGLAKKMNMLPERYAGLQDPAQVMSWLALPFLLIANFAQIMNGKKSYKSLLISNFCAAAAIWAGYAFFLHRYIVGTVDVNRKDAYRERKQDLNTPNIYDLAVQHKLIGGLRVDTSSFGDRPYHE